MAKKSSKKDLKDLLLGIRYEWITYTCPVKGKQVVFFPVKYYSTRKVDFITGKQYLASDMIEKILIKDDELQLDNLLNGADNNDDPLN